MLVTFIDYDTKPRFTHEEIVDPPPRWYKYLVQPFIGVVDDDDDLTMPAPRFKEYDMLTVRRTGRVLYFNKAIYDDLRYAIVREYF